MDQGKCPIVLVKPGDDKGKTNVFRRDSIAPKKRIRRRGRAILLDGGK